MSPPTSVWNMQTQTSLDNNTGKTQCCQSNLRTGTTCCSNIFLSQHFYLIQNEWWSLWQCKSLLVWTPLWNLDKWGIFRKSIIKLPSLGNSLRNGSPPMMPTETAYCMWETDRERSIRNYAVNIFKHLQQGSWMKH